MLNKNLCMWKMATATLRNCRWKVMFHQDKREWRLGVILHKCSERRPSDKVLLFLFCTRIDSYQILRVQLSLQIPYPYLQQLLLMTEEKFIFQIHSVLVLNFQVCLKNKKFQTGRTKYLWYLLSSLDSG